MIDLARRSGKRAIAAVGPVLACLAATALCSMPAYAAAQSPERSGKQIVEASCVRCHAPGLDGAPRIGDRNAWAKRAAQGLTSLTRRALEGIRRMPPHGGNPDLTDQEIARAITYMVNQSGGNWTEPVDRAHLPAERAGEQVVRMQCAKCHETGIDGAPRIGDRTAWLPRLGQGLDSLVRSAINGHGGMPPRGGMANLTDIEFRSAIVYMINVTATVPMQVSPGQDYRIMGETTIHFGVVPASLIRDHPKDYPAEVLRAAPPVPDQYYVTVALLDVDSGKRIGDAVVRARVSTPGGAGPEKLLEPVTIANSLTYGNYFAMAGAARYTIALRIQRPGAAEPIHAQFVYARP